MKTLKEIAERREAIANRRAELGAKGLEAAGVLPEAEAKELAELRSEDAALATVEPFARDVAEAEAFRASRQMAVPLTLKPGEAVPATLTNPVVEDLPRHGKLQAFRGQDAARNAYRAGRWFAGQVLGDERSLTWCRDNGIETRALSTKSNADGGYLVIPEFAQAIIDLREEYGVARRECDVVPMASDTLSVPRRAGGVTAYFVSDNAEITASDPAWDQVTLTARKLAVLTKYSSELADDALVSVADRIATEMAYAFAVKEDACLFLGTGASTYGGIVGLITRCAAATAGIYTAATGNTAFSTLDLVDLTGLKAKLPSYPGIRPKWYVHKSGWGDSMERLKYSGGGVSGTELANGVPQETFLGYPVVFVPAMNSTLTAQTSTNGLVYFGDLRMAATLGSRRDIRVKASDQRYFELDQLAIQATERFDIVVHDVGDTSNAGAVVMLATPGS